MAGNTIVLKHASNVHGQGQIKETSFDYDLRLLISRPKAPSPKSENVPGSGTVFTLISEI